MFIVHRPQQLRRRRGDLVRHFGDGLFRLLRANLQLLLGDLIVGDHLSDFFDPGHVPRQLCAAMPGQVLFEALVEPGLLLAVHVQVVVERPRHQHVEVAISQVDAAAGQHQQGREHQQ
ncbi:hypothetical protein D3C76_1587800 [compost metagenome]